MKNIIAVISAAHNMENVVRWEKSSLSWHNNIIPKILPYREYRACGRTVPKDTLAVVLAFVTSGFGSGSDSGEESCVPDMWGGC